VSETVSWNYTVQVAGGPTVAGSGTLVVEAYVKLNVTVPKNKSLEVEILPGTGGKVQVLVIRPTVPSDKLSYEVGVDTVVLDGPHILVGVGAVSLLAASLGTLKFKNDTTADAEISILAGRDATPSPPSP